MCCGTGLVSAIEVISSVCRDSQCEGPGGCEYQSKPLVVGSVEEDWGLPSQKLPAQLF